MALEGGQDKGGQLVWKMDDDTIVPVRVMIDSDGNLVPVPSGPGSTEGKQQDQITLIGDGNQKTQIVDGLGNAIGSLNNALNIHSADVHIKVISRHFIDFNGEIENPSSPITTGDKIIQVASTTGFSPGVDFVIKDANGDTREHHFTVTSIVADTSITPDRAIDIGYTTSATLEVVRSDLNVNGSLASPIVYEVTPPSDEIWHITRIMLSITDNTTGQFDDSKFAGLSALTNGVVLRENKSIMHSIENWKSNSEMIISMFDLQYSDSAPAGNEGLRGRFTFTNSGAIVKLDGSQDETLQVLIQDNLSSLTGFKVKAQGHLEG